MVEIASRRNLELGSVGIELVRTIATTVEEMTSDWSTDSSQTRRAALLARSVADTTQPAAHGTVVAGAPHRVRVELRVPPDALPSIDTEEAGVRWTVEAAVALGGLEVVETVPVQVVADDPSLEPDADTPPVSADNGARLSFADLSSRRLSPGDPIAGTLVIEPSGVEVQKVVVVLGLSAAGPPPRGLSGRHEVVRRVVATAGAVADAVAGRRMIRIPFSIDVPDPVPAPSIDVDGMSVRWFLRAFTLHPGLTAPSSDVELGLYVRATPTA
jgi:hypothetical protein